LLTQSHTTPAKGGLFLPQYPVLTAEQQKLNDVWNEHMRAEFDAHSADETIAIMVAHPIVNAVPVMIGGDGKAEVYEFYAKHFLPQIPPDFEFVPVSRTIGQGRLVDEMVVRFTHTIPMDWILPGIPPTGKRVEVAFIVLVQFDGTSWYTNTSFGIRHQCWCSWGSSNQKACRS
jgi:carboxymethylenebutenolidase